MKHNRLLLILALVVSTAGIARAQGSVNAMENDFGGRFSVTADKKIVKGVHLFAEGEVRMSDNFSSLGRYQAGMGVTWKITDVFKVGTGYTFIQKQNSEGTWKPRHRVYLDGAVNLKAGYWRFSIKERLQLTHREVNNAYQNNPNSLALKSRFKIAYKGLQDVTPYGYIELRNVFNDPSVKATWSTTSLTYAEYSFGGYNDAYINRVRGSLGAEWKLSKKHALDFFLLTDYNYDKNIDTDAAGTTLKSLTWDQGINLSLGVGYKFAL
ncbi:MAG: DUF2490 domain-containing protein [Bacteroidales bacterium]|nr:DUF2490 domain-containing protein [Bacteroidales bacterium]